MVRVGSLILDLQGSAQPRECLHVVCVVLSCKAQKAMRPSTWSVIEFFFGLSLIDGDRRLVRNERKRKETGRKRGRVETDFREYDDIQYWAVRSRFVEVSRGEVEQLHGFNDDDKRRG